MWEKPLKKTIYVLEVDGYSKELTELTRPLLIHWSKKIGATIQHITKRKFPKFPPVYEKLQIYELAQENGSDWNIYIDSDALIHPDFFDPTVMLSKDTVLHNGSDMAANRWRYDRFFLRDGRNIGSCNWFTIASDWCIDLWHPLDDMTRDEAISHIYPTRQELATIITPDHLIDDYTLSRNIAKYGLKFTTMAKMLEKIGQPGFSYLWHQYQIPVDKKVDGMLETIKVWDMETESLQPNRDEIKIRTMDWNTNPLEKRKEEIASIFKKWFT